LTPLELALGLGQHARGAAKTKPAIVERGGSSFENTLVEAGGSLSSRALMEAQIQVVRKREYRATPNITGSGHDGRCEDGEAPDVIRVGGHLT
jgi:hypothetical protein